MRTVIAAVAAAGLAVPFAVVIAAPASAIPAECEGQPPNGPGALQWMTTCQNAIMNEDKAGQQDCDSTANFGMNTCPHCKLMPQTFPQPPQPVLPCDQRFYD